MAGMTRSKLLSNARKHPCARLFIPVPEVLDKSDQNFLAWSEALKFLALDVLTILKTEQHVTCFPEADSMSLR